MSKTLHAAIRKLSNEFALGILKSLRSVTLGEIVTYQATGRDPGHPSKPTKPRGPGRPRKSHATAG